MEKTALLQGKIIMDENQAEPSLGLKDSLSLRKHVDEIMRLQQRAIEASADGIIILDALLPGIPILYVNPAFERMTGYSAEEAIGKDCQFLLGKDQTQLDLYNLLYAMQEGREARAVLHSNRKDGSLFWGEVHIAPVRTEEEQITHYVGIITDVTERKHMEDQLMQQATHDALTGLPNRLLLIDRIAQAITYANRTHNQVVLLFIDLDHFKYVNDTFGHSRGDMLLEIAAKRLVDCMRESDTVARLGGDEFVVLLTSVNSERNIATVAQKILKVLAMPYTIDKHEVILSASVGISIYPKDGTDTESLLKNADIAMYRAKETGRNSFHFFTDELNQRVQQRTLLERHLHHALARQELLLHYQPLLDLGSGKICGFEALLRWQHPSLGLVSPLQFVSLAEETGLIIDIGDWIIQTACAQVKAWQDLGLPKVSIAINLSGKQLKQFYFVDKVKNILAKTGLDPTCLVFELTESIIIENLKETAEMLKQLRQLGISIVIDDFGTGYSSLSYLKQLPVDKIKIDKIFIDDITNNEEDAAITKAIIAMAKSLKLKVLAEGVEKVEQLQYLKAAGCDEMQGYYFSRPVVKEACEEMLRDGVGLSG